MFRLLLRLLFGRAKPRSLPPHSRRWFWWPMQSLSGRAYVLDGDGIQIGKYKLRLAGIDAPEHNHPWGPEAKAMLAKLCHGKIIHARLSRHKSYDRIVATCFLPDGRDLSAEMVRRGMAIDWPKFSGGKYARFEPRGIRQRHWRAVARQKGDMARFHSRG